MCNTGLSGYEDRSRKENEYKMKQQIYNPYLPLENFFSVGEPLVFGDRLYVYGSHDEENGTEFCVLDYECFSTPVDDLSDWRSEGSYIVLSRIRGEMKRISICMRRMWYRERMADIIFTMP